MFSDIAAVINVVNTAHRTAGVGPAISIVRKHVQTLSLAFATAICNTEFVCGVILCFTLKFS